jgi:hypothetical protein
MSGVCTVKRPPFDAGPRRQPRQLLERADEFGPAVGIAGVVERVDADEDVRRAEHLGPSHGDGQEDRVAGRHVGARDDARIDRLILRHVDLLRRQRRSADARQVEVDLEVAFRANCPGNDAARPRVPVSGAGRN